MIGLGVRKNVSEDFTPQWALYTIRTVSAVTAIALTALASFNQEKIIFASLITLVVHRSWLPEDVALSDPEDVELSDRVLRGAYLGLVLFKRLGSLPAALIGTAGFFFLKKRVSTNLSPALSDTSSVIHFFILGSGLSSFGIFILSHFAQFLSQHSNPLMFWLVNGSGCSAIILTGIINFHNGVFHLSSLASQFFQHRHENACNKRYEQFKQTVDEFLNKVKNKKELNEKDDYLRSLKEIFVVVPSLQINQQQEIMLDLMKSTVIVPDFMTAKEFVSKWSKEAFTRNLIRSIKNNSKEIGADKSKCVAYMLNRMTDEKEIKEIIDFYNDTPFYFLTDLKDFGETPSQALIQTIFKNIIIQKGERFAEQLLMLSWMERGAEFDDCMRKMASYLYERMLADKFLPDEILNSKEEEAQLIKQSVFLFTLSETQSYLDIAHSTIHANVIDLGRNVNRVKMTHLNNLETTLRVYYKQARSMITKVLDLLEIVREDDVEGLVDQFLETVKQISAKTESSITLDCFIPFLPKKALMTLQKRYDSFNQAVDNMDEMINQIEDLNQRCEDSKLNEKGIQAALGTYQTIVKTKMIISRGRDIWIKEKDSLWYLRQGWIKWFNKHDDAMSLILLYAGMQNKTAKSIELFNALLEKHGNTLATWQEQQQNKHAPDTYSFYTYITSKRQKTAFVGKSGLVDYNTLSTMLRTHFAIDENILDDDDLFQHKLSEVGFRTGKDFDKLKIEKDKSDKEVIEALDNYIKECKAEKELVAADEFLEGWCGKGWHDNEELRMALKMNPGDDIREVLSTIGLKTRRDLMNSGCLPIDQDLIEMYTNADEDDPTIFEGLYLKHITASLKNYMLKIAANREFSLPSVVCSLADRVSQIAFFCLTEGILFIPSVFSFRAAPMLLLGLVIGLTGSVGGALISRRIMPILFESLLPSLLVKGDDRSTAVPQRFKQAGIIERIAMIRNQCLKVLFYVGLGNFIAGLQGLALGMKAFNLLPSYFRQNLERDRDFMDCYERVLEAIEGIELSMIYPGFDFVLNPCR
jgi:hypothetical protein